MSLHTATAVGSCAAPLSGLSFIGKTLTGNGRFTPKSGHSSGVAQCPLCAKSGHWVASGSSHCLWLEPQIAQLIGEAVGPSVLLPYDNKICTPIQKEPLDPLRPADVTAWG